MGDFKPVEKKIKTNKTERASKIEELKEKLNKAIKEERYEDAAKIRDEIKKEEGILSSKPMSMGSIVFLASNIKVRLM